MSEDLGRGLAELAEEVSVVDLRDRALLTSRRLTRRRRVLAATAAAVAVGVLAGGTAAFWPTNLAGPPNLPGQTTTPPVSPTSASPTPSATVSDPLAPRLGDWVSTPRPSLPETVVYLSFDVVSGERYQYFVHRLAGGVEQVAPLGPEVNATNCSFNIPSISPDGSMVMMAAGGAEQPDGWVEGASLYVTELATGQSRRLVETIVCGATIWSPDSSRVLASTSSGCQWVRVADGAQSPYEGSGCGYVAFAPGGEFRAKYPELMTSAGDVVATLPRPADLPASAPAEAQAVAVDGRLVAVGPGSNDPGYQREARWVLDTSTGEYLTTEQVLGPGHAGESITNVAFLADGGMVVATLADGDQRAWYLLSAVGVVTATLTDAPGPILTGRFTYLS